METDVVTDLDMIDAIVPDDAHQADMLRVILREALAYQRDGDRVLTFLYRQITEAKATRKAYIEAYIRLRKESLAASRIRYKEMADGQLKVDVSRYPVSVRVRWEPNVAYSAIDTDAVNLRALKGNGALLDLIYEEFEKVLLVKMAAMLRVEFARVLGEAVEMSGEL